MKQYREKFISEKRYVRKLIIITRLPSRACKANGMSNEAALFDSSLGVLGFSYKEPSLQSPLLLFS